MKRLRKIPNFKAQPDDPLAAAHAMLTQWVTEIEITRPSWEYWRDADLKSLCSGEALLAAPPAQARCIVLAAAVQERYYYGLIEQVFAGVDATDAVACKLRDLLSGRLREATNVTNVLLRRALPLERGDLESLLEWCMAQSVQVSYRMPAGQLTKSLERHAAAHGIDAELRVLMKRFAQWLRVSRHKDGARLSTTISQLCGEAGGEAAPEPAAVAVKPAPEPAASGNPLVLRALKAFLGTAAGPKPETVEIGPDRFDVAADSPLRAEHDTLSKLLEQGVAAKQWDTDPRKLAEGRRILALEPGPRGRVLLAAAERHVASLLDHSRDLDETQLWYARYALASFVPALAGEPFELDRDALFDFLLYMSIRPYDQQAVFATLQDKVSAASFTEGERWVLHRWRCARIAGPLLGSEPRDIQQLTEWIGDGARFFLAPGEHWSDAVNACLAAMPAGARANWVALLRHALTATSSRPSDRWKQTAVKMLGTIGDAAVQQAIERWFPLVAKGRTFAGFPAYLHDTRAFADTMQEENATALRGLLWMVPLLAGRDKLVRMAGAVALSAYKKVPGVGPRAVKVGNAAVYTLSEMVSPEAAGQLAMLKVRVRFGTAQKEIEKAFDAAAKQLALPRGQVEELSVPSCGLETVGRREETLGEYRAELTVTGSDAALQWFDSKGKALKSAPASLKKDHAETLKELQQSLKDTQAMLGAQRERVDALFLERKSWTAAAWRERYLDHPLVGAIGRRLIWCIGDTAVTVADGTAMDSKGRPVAIADDATVTLWHPAGRSVREVVEWRRRIESLGIVQPFKQAHREVYLLTDAERRTATYSNRFGAHILRQHQFNALCGTRRWKNKLRMLVDAEYPPAGRDLPAWGLRAEFWVEGVGEDHGTDTNEAGAFLRLASDQVRFHRIGAASNAAHAGGGGYSSTAAGPGAGDVNEPLPLEQIPPLVFSEIMRDVDLFVGVSSVANDPTWQDGGPGGRYRDYWQQHSFGELSATAASRRDVLERLVPRLNIADRCRISDRFLIVRGDRRTYKIHLGSGNILMEPNDQYLCIVPDARMRSQDQPVYLPFEGDTTLAIILSKAFLLANDTKIADQSITRQIG